MAKHIKLNCILDELNKVLAYFDNGDIRYGIDIAINQIKKQSYIDIDDIINCKDCKHYIDDNYCDCDFALNLLRPDDYCSYAERKYNDG